jgi:hypothetical protein
MFSLLSHSSIAILFLIFLSELSLVNKSTLLYSLPFVSFLILLSIDWFSVIFDICVKFELLILSLLLFFFPSIFILFLLIIFFV